jgi:hypothetical protein
LSIVGPPYPLLVNALANLARLTGTPPWLHIGADMEERTDENVRVLRGEMRKVLIALHVSQDVFPKTNHVYSHPEGSLVIFSRLSSHAIL